MSTSEINRILIERFHCGELTGDDQKRVLRMIDENDKARAYLRKLEDARETYQKTYPFRIAEWEERLPQRNASPWVAILSRVTSPMAGAALVTCLLLFIVNVGIYHSGSSSKRIKGNSSISYVVERNNNILDAEILKVFRPGDRLQFFYNNNSWPLLQFFSIDNKGRITWYSAVRSDGTRAEDARKGTSIPLPYSIVLDSIGQSEAFVLILCSHPIKASLIEKLSSLCERTLDKENNIKLKGQFADALGTSEAAIFCEIIDKKNQQ